MVSKILVVAATTLEISPTLSRDTGAPGEGVGSPGTLFKGKSKDILISGVGQMLCGVHVARALSTGRYTQVIQAGIGGSFNAAYPKGAVVIVGEEFLADLGAEDNGVFLDLFDMGLLSREDPPFTEGALVAPLLDLKGLSRLPRVRSVTVNRVLSEERSINWVQRRFSPDVVNMEGAALFYACLSAGVPFVSIRAISDMVGPRDKSAWDIPGAVRALNTELAALLDEGTRDE